MKSHARLSLLLTVALAVTACSGGSNNSSPNPAPAPAPPPATTPPPAVDTVFSTFVLGLIGQTSETSTPVDINSTNFTFSEDANAFNSVLGGP